VREARLDAADSGVARREATLTYLRSLVLLKPVVLFLLRLSPYSEGLP